MGRTIHLVAFIASTHITHTTQNAALTIRKIMYNRVNPQGLTRKIHRSRFWLNSLDITSKNLPVLGVTL